MTVVCYRQPIIGGMTVITLFSGHEMPLWLAGGGSAVMTGVAALAHTGVIEIDIGPCSGGDMAVVTLGCGRHVIC